jgi:acyl transferase domain-containing protein
MFGHTLAGSGALGFLRAALVLRHKILPPSVIVGKLHPRLVQSQLYVPEEPRPWVAGASPRLAGATAVDPTGICGHAILQEFSP